MADETTKDEAVDATEASPTTGDATGTKPFDQKAESNGGNPDKPSIRDTPEFKEEVTRTVESVLKGRVEQALRKHQEDAEKAAEKAKKAAEAKAAAESGEFRQLAESRREEIEALTAKLAEFEPWKEKAERYEAALTKQLTTLRKGLPKDIGELLDDLDPVKQLEWLAAHPERIAREDPARPANGTATRRGALAAPGEVIRHEPTRQKYRL